MGLDRSEFSMEDSPQILSTDFVEVDVTDYSLNE